MRKALANRKNIWRENHDWGACRRNRMENLLFLTFYFSLRHFLFLFAGGCALGAERWTPTEKEKVTQREKASSPGCALGAERWTPVKTGKMSRKWWSFKKRNTPANPGGGSRRGLEKNTIGTNLSHLAYFSNEIDSKFFWKLQKMLPHYYKINWNQNQIPQQTIQFTSASRNLPFALKDSEVRWFWIAKHNFYMKMNNRIIENVKIQYHPLGVVPCDDSMMISS